MRPERASYSSRASRLVAKHVKVFIVGTGGQGHVVFLSGAVHSRAQIGLLYSNLQELNFQRTVLVEFIQVAQDLRDHLVMLTYSPVGCRSQRNGRKMKSRREDLLVFHARSFYIRCETAASHAVLRRTTNEHIIAFAFCVTYRSVSY